MAKKKAAKPTKAEAAEMLVGDLADLLADERYNGVLWKIREAAEINLIATAVATNARLVASLMR